MNDSIVKSKAIATNVSWKRNFLKIYIGQAFSLLSSNAVQFAIIWWITIETGSARHFKIYHKHNIHYEYHKHRDTRRIKNKVSSNR